MRSGGVSGVKRQGRVEMGGAPHGTLGKPRLPIARPLTLIRCRHLEQVNTDANV